MNFKRKPLTKDIITIFNNIDMYITKSALIRDHKSELSIEVDKDIYCYGGYGEKETKGDIYKIRIGSDKRALSGINRYSILHFDSELGELWSVDFYQKYKSNARIGFYTTTDISKIIKRDQIINKLI